MAFLKRLVSTLLWLALFAAVVWIVWDRGVLRVPLAAIDPSGESAFEQWLDEEPERRAEYRALQAFLAENDAAGIVPAWQLARVDRFYAERCGLPIWRLPPRDLWPNVLPALRLVRDEVVPAVGPVAVQSSYRTPELNVCARGASQSRHLRFEALDLRLETPRADVASLYRDLCAMHDAAGPASCMGLGAYYDFNDDGFNRGGRFHIDGAGYRTWGRTYTSASSPCGRL